MLKIGNIEINSNVIAAPLAGYTNLAYRNFLKEFAPVLVVSEMISDCALIYQNSDTYKMLNTSGEIKPISLQLFGGKKETLIQAVKILQENADFDILDINLGCPVNKVVKGNAGSSWLKPGRENELYEMMSAVVNACEKPVTAKIRLGWDNNSINCVEIAKILEKAGVKMITVHGRTRSQLYGGNANYELIKKVKEAVNIPVIANGDIDSPLKAKEVLDYTKADGIMVGRACLGNPYLLTQIDTYLKEGIILDNPSIKQQIQYVKKHYEMLKKEKGEFLATREMRSIAPRYFKGYDNTKTIRVKLTRIESSKDIYETLSKLEDNDL